MSIPLTERNASLTDMLATLNLQHESKLDAIVPAEAIRSVGGTLVVEGMGPDGPAGEPGLFQPTAIMDGQIAGKLGIPVDYLRTLRNGKSTKDRTTKPRLDLYDANVNGWLRGHDLFADPDPRRFMFRAFTDPEGGVGIARSLLSDSYRAMDHLDMVTAVFAGIRESGVDIDTPHCDLTETRMTLHINAPEVTVLAQKFLEGYRSPFERSGHGQEGLRDDDGNLPIVSAGLVITNSETGGGAYTIAPRFTVKVCTNGMCITQDAVRSVHLGSKLEEGVIKWTHATHERSLELVAAKTRDAVATFLDVEYMQMVMDRLTDQATTPLTDAAKTVELVGSKLSYTEEQRAGILDHFIKGGQLIAGGVMQAVTSYAQTVADPDTAFDLEWSATAALALAAASA